MSTAIMAGRSSVGARALAIALVAVVGLLLLPFVSGLMGAGILYVIAEPLLRRLHAIRARRLAALAVVFALCALLVLPALAMFAQLIAEAPQAIATIQQSRAWQHVMTWHIGTLAIGAELQEASSELIHWGSRQTLALLGGVIASTINLVIALFGCYYLLMTGDRLWERTQQLLPFEPGTSEALRARFHSATEAMLLGVVLAGVAQGTLVGVALALAGFEQALFWGAVTAACSVLPMFGSALVWLPASIVLVAQQRPVAAVGLGLFGALVVANTDNALRLVVYRRISHIHPMVTLVGAFAGVHAFGLAGLLIGPLLLCYAIELLHIAHSVTPALDVRAA